MAVNLSQWINHPQELNQDTLYELRNLVDRYPYFQTARLLYLKNLYLLHNAAFGEELRKATLYVADRRVLFYFIEGERFALLPQSVVAEQIDIPEEEPGLDRTLTLIDAFLATMPDEGVVQLEYATEDYTHFLLQQEEPEAELAVRGIAEEEPASGNRSLELIDHFMENTKEEPTFRLSPQDPEEPSVCEPAVGDEELDDSYFTETLAKIYIKQHRYSKAIEIIKKLNLKYPKKNTYFADQIRFLEKLIINAKSK